MEDASPTRSGPGSDNPLLSDLVWEVSGLIAARGEEALLDLGISTASSGMLAALNDSPGVTVTQLADRFGKTQQSVSEMAARLTGLGLVERRVGRGRSVGLHLTESGRALTQRAVKRESEVETELEALLGDASYDRLRHELLTLRTTLRAAAHSRPRP